MTIAVLVFPGTWSDSDCHHALTRVLGVEAHYVWHQERDLSAYEGAILPGGFSYGDYLRAGAIARFSPVMEGVREMVRRGKPVMGICNGFQILCEAGLLPGALLRNSHLQYRCQWVNLRVENPRTPFTRLCTPGQVLRVPISHGEGRFYAEPATLAAVEEKGQVVFRYTTPEGQPTEEANPNGSLNNIAGIVSREGNVLGMMPHPERCCEEVLGGTDGLWLFRSMLGA